MAATKTARTVKPKASTKRLTPRKTVKGGVTLVFVHGKGPGK